MPKWFMLFLVFGSPCLAAKLHGKVTTAEGKSLDGARIVILHDMAMALVQRGITDFNGTYHFNLNPGPYRIFVLKRGYHPVAARILIVQEREELQLEHELEAQLEVGQNRREGNRNVLKEVLRKSNRDPFRAVGANFQVSAGAPTSEHSAFYGSLRSGQTRRLDGELNRQSTVQVSTQLGNQFALRSKLSTDHQETGERARHISAHLAMNLPQTEVGLEAESIRTEQAEQDTRRAELSGEYGSQIRGATRMQLMQSTGADNEQRQLSLSQQVRYHLGEHRLDHNITFSNWQQQGQTYARQGSLQTTWHHQNVRWLGLGGGMDHITVAGRDSSDARVWIRGQHNDLWHFLDLDSSVGYRGDHHESDLIQDHRLTGQFNGWKLEAGYRDDSHYQGFTSDDIFGSYLVQLATPYNNESFYENHEKRLFLGLALEHGWGNSSLSWNHRRNEAEMLYAHQDKAFRQQADLTSERVAYRLGLERYGASFELSYSDNEAEAISFNHTELSYRQSLSPFRNKALGLLLELSVRDNPTVPAWWLLESLPWNPNGNENWYEGHVALQF